MASEVKNQQSHPLQQDHVSVSSDGLVTDYSLPSLRQTISVTLDLFHPSLHTQLENPCRLHTPKLFLLKAAGDQKKIYIYIYIYIYNLLHGVIASVRQKRYLEAGTGTTTMSHRNGKESKLELKLNLSLAGRANPPPESASSESPISPPPNSCVSSEINQDGDETLSYTTNSPEATSMMLVGCPRCLMYVMLQEEDPRCPRCKNTILLDIISQNATPTATTSTKNTKKAN